MFSSKLGEEFFLTLPNFCNNLIGFPGKRLFIFCFTPHWDTFVYCLVFTQKHGQFLVTKFFVLTSLNFRLRPASVFVPPKKVSLGGPDCSWLCSRNSGYTNVIYLCNNCNFGNASRRKSPCFFLSKDSPEIFLQPDIETWKRVKVETRNSTRIWGTHMEQSFCKFWGQSVT